MKFTTPTKEARQLALLWGAVAVAAVALRPFWLALVPFMPTCPLRAATGVPCPTCGTTRAAVALLHGDVASAVLANPLAAFAAVAFVVGGVVATMWALVQAPAPVLPHRLSAALRIAIVAALLANWAWVIAHR